MIKEHMKEYDNDGRLRVYLAGPFFNEEQIERINYIEELLDKLNFDVFSPRQASKITPNATKQDMIDTFEGNVSHINGADFVLAILDGNDSGTLFECGYAYEKKNVLYFNETREKGPNLMLALSGGLPFITKSTKTLTSLLEPSYLHSNHNLDNVERSPRELLEIVLHHIKDTGVENIMMNTVMPFDEVE